MSVHPTDDLRERQPLVADLAMGLRLIGLREDLSGDRPRVDQQRKLVEELFEGHEMVLGTRHDQRVLSDPLGDFEVIVRLELEEVLGGRCSAHHMHTLLNAPSRIKVPFHQATSHHVEGRAELQTNQGIDGNLRYRATPGM